MTVAPPTSNPHGPAIPAATYPGNLGHERKPDSPRRRGGSQPVSTGSGPSWNCSTTGRVPAANDRATGGRRPFPCRRATRSAASRFRQVSVVATVLERQRQIEAVHAYWRLAEAIGEFHFCQERQQQIARLRAANGEATDLRTARAVATAQIGEAEVQIATAQHDLAEILLLAPAAPLPLPEDRPLTGPYRTLFAELFAGRRPGSCPDTRPDAAAPQPGGGKSRGRLAGSRRRGWTPPSSCRPTARSIWPAFSPPWTPMSGNNGLFWPPSAVTTTTSPITPSQSFHRKQLRISSPARSSSKIGRRASR